MNEMHGIQPGAVLEVGSRDYNGTPRDLFAGAEYVGIDTKAGTGVDMVLSVYELSQLFQGAAFDAVLALNVLEHLDNIWAALIELGKALKVGGYFYVSMPGFGYPQHDYPGDYWRVSEQAMRDVIMLDYEILSLEHAKTQWGKHPMIHCLGRKCLP
jgi:predicted SAM-dependent methyltransferase